MDRKEVNCRGCKTFKGIYAKGMCKSCYHKNYYKSNKEKIDEYHKKYYVKNAKKYYEYSKKAYKKKQEKGYYKKYYRNVDNAIKMRIRNYSQYHMPITKDSKCIICNEQATAHHHFNYTKNPLDCVFVCNECHSYLDEVRLELNNTKNGGK